MYYPSGYDNLDATKEPIQPLLMNNEYENQLFFGTSGGSYLDSQNFSLGYNASSDHLYQERQDNQDFLRAQFHHVYQLHQQLWTEAYNAQCLREAEAESNAKDLSNDERKQIIDESFKMLEEFKEDQA